MSNRNTVINSSVNIGISLWGWLIDRQRSGSYSLSAQIATPIARPQKGGVLDSSRLSSKRCRHFITCATLRGGVDGRRGGFARSGAAHSHRDATRKRSHAGGQVVLSRTHRYP